LLTTLNGRVGYSGARPNRAGYCRHAAQGHFRIDGLVAPDAGTVDRRAAGRKPWRAGGRQHHHHQSHRADTPFGTVPRQVSYQVGAIFEVGVYDYDNAFVIMPIPDAQTLLLTGDSIGMIEVKTDNADKAAEMLAPLGKKLAGQATITDWKTINAQLFEALAVDRVVMLSSAR
jgi:lipoprotein-releasing system permease protein